MKVVKQISTGKIIYSQSPDFETGKGILNAKILNPSIPEADIMEEKLNITEQEYQNLIKSQTDYTELRRREYRTIQDQLDDFWHAMDAGILPKVEPFYSSSKAVKIKYPKPA